MYLTSKFISKGGGVRWVEDKRGMQACALTLQIPEPELRSVQKSNNQYTRLTLKEKGFGKVGGEGGGLSRVLTWTGQVADDTQSGV